MAKLSQKTQKDSAAANAAKPTAKVKRTRKSVPRDSPPQRSSVYRGVTRHRWTGRYEAHLWDKNCWNESQNKKGRQGAYDDEEAAAHAYDLAALKKSSGFSRGVSKYRGVARHHHNGRWEARIGRVFGNKYLYLGTYATQEEAATAYDMAAIEYRGLNAVTNFDLSRYIKWLRPNHQSDANSSENAQQDLNSDTNSTLSPKDDIGVGFSIQPQSYSTSETSETPLWLGSGGGGGSAANASSASSALGLLLQSSKFKEMLERTSVVDSPSPPPEPDVRRRSFPDDIQTYFDCQDSSNYTESDDIFGDLNPFVTPMFHCELDG
ncbi:hypothetical protein CCACVL1_11435 [Corchorus capsularis]|uniref:AP2/ERF domain-containing protein n=1 Tax=Corchorus capsularis TaxID=210143 RepID=A0A1R3IL37_COCAP|nr:hypothetical protein CCACVL1_11435 [Corchorus capsularis]